MVVLFFCRIKYMGDFFSFNVKAYFPSTYYMPTVGTQR